MTVNGNSTTRVIIDSDKLENALDSAGKNATVTIPVTTDCDTVSIAISGDSIDAMSGSGAILEIQTEYGTYTLPASKIDMDSIAEQLGADASEIEITITMGIPSDDTAAVVENAAEEGEFSIVVPALEFTITCSCGGQSVEIDSFDSYVERTIAIPDGIDPEKITTAVVVEPDGTVRHVPTYITEINGVYYAVINSPTNSVYALIYNPVSFADADGHWAEAAISDMASRKIISGYTNGYYVPEGEITRAEFAAVIVRALGLPAGIGENNFSDVSASDWCCGSVETAVSYGLMSGYPDGNFGPSDALTREQAMAVIARAMDITELDAGLSDVEIASLLAGYTDACKISAYAADGAAACLKTGVITGRTNGMLAPQGNITRAETAVVIQRLLVTSGLINKAKSASTAVASDYSAADNWLSLPETNEYDVDVFYLYPTAYYRLSPDDAVVCGIGNPLMRTNAASAFNRQATAFSTAGNIYAPYYRQPDAVTSLSLSEEAKDELLGGVTKADVFAAFDYYIEHYNNGRPFILAGHSLGSNMLLYLLSEYMEEHPDVYARMVAAYVIGYSVTEDYLAENPHLKFAEGAGDTGVIISYNTQAAMVEGANPVVLDGALVINPITWTRGGATAGAEENLGSIMLNPDGSVVLDENGGFKRVMNFADATADIEKGALICSTVDADTWAPGNAVFPKGVFHSFDYPFYYYNIRENAANRTNQYLGNS